MDSVQYPGIFSSNLLHSIPALPSVSIGGTEIGQSILSMAPDLHRDQWMVLQCSLGYLPGWMRDFKSITISEKGNTLSYFVSPDVLCLGDENDFLRIVCGGNAAKRICDMFSCMLPTKKIADQIWAAADLKLTPHPMLASASMVSSKVLIDHNAEIERERNGRDFNIITGHKKDIVICSHLLQDRSRIAIYGWIYPDGRVIQGPMPNSTSHEVNYMDYSQSIRLISRKGILNGSMVDLYSVIKDSSYSYLINHENAYDPETIYG